MECFSLKDRLDGSVYEAYTALNDKEKTIISLHYEKGFSLHEIARILDESYDTVQKRHKRMLDKFKNII